MERDDSRGQPAPNPPPVAAVRQRGESEGDDANWPANIDVRHRAGEENWYLHERGEDAKLNCNVIAQSDTERSIDAERCDWKHDAKQDPLERVEVCANFE